MRTSPAPGPRREALLTELAYIDILANPKIRFEGVKKMAQIQNTSWSFAETKYFRVAVREHTLAPPGPPKIHKRRLDAAAAPADTDS